MDTNEPNLPLDPWETPGAAGRNLNNASEPPPNQWAAIEARMKKDRRRRGLFWLWPLALLLAGGGAWYGLSSREGLSTDSGIARTPPKDNTGLGNKIGATSKSTLEHRGQAQLPGHKKPSEARVGSLSQSADDGGQKMGNSTSAKKVESGYGSVSSPPSNAILAKVTIETRPRLGHHKSKKGNREELAQPTDFTKPLLTAAGTGTGITTEKGIATERPSASNKASTSQNSLKGNMEPAQTYEIDIKEQTTNIEETQKTQSEALVTEQGNAASPDKSVSPDSVASTKAVREPEYQTSSYEADSALALADSTPTEDEVLVKRHKDPRSNSKLGFAGGSIYYGLSTLTYASQARVAANADQAANQYRLTKLGDAFGSLAKVGYHIPITPDFGVSAEVQLGASQQRGTYQVTPGASSNFTHPIQIDSLSYTSQPQTTVQHTYRQTTGYAGLALLARYRIGIVSLSVGGRWLGYAPLGKTPGPSGQTLQPYAGVAVRVRSRLSLEASAQPFRLNRDAVNLPLASSSRGWLYGIGLVWDLP